MVLTYDEFVREAKAQNEEFILHLLQVHHGREFDLDDIWNFEKLISYEELKSGDILYFGFGESKDLVGVALTDHKFIYVGNSGLKESNLKSSVWFNYLIGIRRIKDQEINDYE